MTTTGRMGRKKKVGGWNMRIIPRKLSYFHVVNTRPLFMFQPRRENQIRLFVLYSFTYWFRFILFFAFKEFQLIWICWGFFVQNQNSPRRSKSMKHKNGESICIKFVPILLYFCWNLGMVSHIFLKFNWKCWRKFFVQTRAWELEDKQSKIHAL